MLTKELLAILDIQDRHENKWLFTVDCMKSLFPGESDFAIKRSLRRHSDAGFLSHVCQGIYANERALCMPRHAPLEALIPVLRPGVLNYISLESRLSELGVISQIPSTLTVMTKGRRLKVKTKYGTIEFTHTKKMHETLLPTLSSHSVEGVFVADVATAISDLKSTRRNLSMIDHEELAEMLSA